MPPRSPPPSPPPSPHRREGSVSLTLSLGRDGKIAVARSLVFLCHGKYRQKKHGDVMFLRELEMKEGRSGEIEKAKEGGGCGSELELEGRGTTVHWMDR